MNTKIVLVLVGVVVAGAVYAYVSDSKTDMMVNTEESNQLQMAKTEPADDMVKTSDEMMTEPASADEMDKDMMDKSDDMMKKGSYESYSADKLAMAETGDVVLFFHASWCPSCRSLNADIEKEMGSIPDGVTILKVDYDRETELKRKYGVTTQHTLVQVDKDGNLIKKWSGSPKLASLLTEIE